MFFSVFIYALDKNTIHPPEGEYMENIKLEVKNSSSNILFHFENSSTSDPLPFNPSENPVLLSAAEGEEKNYRISFKEKGSSDPPLTLNYTIDRKNLYHLNYSSIII